MLLSIVIPAYNEEKLIGESLEKIQGSIENSSFSESEWEIIVCDNNSTDNTAEIAQQAGAIVVFEKNNHISRARNKGAESANGDWLLFVDADSYPTPDLMNDVYDLIFSGDYFGGGSTVQFIGTEKLYIRIFISLVNLWIRTNNFAVGAFFLSRSQDFKSVGGFSMDLYASEELDLTNRLKALNVHSQMKFKILSKHPFLTSPRKFNLYGFSDWYQLFSRLSISGKKGLRDKSKMSMWYDGRR